MVMFSYWAQPLDCLALSQYLNDHIAGLVDKYPKNYIGLGTLPMQDTELAIKEAERCKKIGLIGIQIGSNINDENLNEERFFPLFQACEKLGLALLIHPWNMMGEKNAEVLVALAGGNASRNFTCTLLDDLWRDF